MYYSYIQGLYFWDKSPSVSLTPNPFYCLSLLTLKQLDLFTFPSNRTPTFAHCYQTPVWIFMSAFFLSGLHLHYNSIKTEYFQYKPFNWIQTLSTNWFAFLQLTLMHLLCFSAGERAFVCLKSSQFQSSWGTILLKEHKNKERHQMYDASVGQLILGFCSEAPRPHWAALFSATAESVCLRLSITGN